MRAHILFRSAGAEEDLIEIWSHIAFDSLGAADRLLDAIEDRWQLLATQPRSGALRGDLGPDIRHLVSATISHSTVSMANRSSFSASCMASAESIPMIWASRSPCILTDARVAIYLFVRASEQPENWIPLFGPML
ncbi:type II toxin-antitoxin system RelE/ParE family toxin [Mesorhizobium sp. CAU 1732]|uniref:type II toxin-antitoxin system RelE/ParE family toxin n=1 Tax=Mesorhizobium sp. CAU 1732 TaxID=3140358 RepID=UPI003260CC8C